MKYLSSIFDERRKIYGNQKCKLRNGMRNYKQAS